MNKKKEEFYKMIIIKYMETIEILKDHLFIIKIDDKYYIEENLSYSNELTEEEYNFLKENFKSYE